MDAIRRGAMAQMGRAVLGTAAAVGGIGRNHAAAGPSPSLQTFARGYSDQASAETYPSALNKIDDSEWRERKRQSEARHRAAAPLRAQLDEIYQRSDRLTMQKARGAGESLHDLAALKSVSPWWKDQVALDRAKKLQTAAQAIQSEIDKLINSPIEALSETFQAAVKSFLAEMNAP